MGIAVKAVIADISIYKRLEVRQLLVNQEVRKVHPDPRPTFSVDFLNRALVGLVTIVG
jgi:aromatic ring-cleaving dioxygenase